MVPLAGCVEHAVTIWLLLVYTVPAEPSRLRAAVWRDLKKAGAVYLRDGVCVLPERDETLHALRQNRTPLAVAAWCRSYLGLSLVTTVPRGKI